jgi:hypothetical protein
MIQIRTTIIERSLSERQIDGCEELIEEQADKMLDESLTLYLFNHRSKHCWSAGGS